MSRTVGSGPPGTAVDQFYRTKLCIPFIKGHCRRGSHCCFAHGVEELKQSLDLQKTKLCPLWLQGGCTMENCYFAHGQEELKATMDYYKTGLCKFWKKKMVCEAGDSCRHAHGVHELRPRNYRRTERDKKEASQPRDGDTSSTHSHLSPPATDMNSTCSLPAPSLAGSATCKRKMQRGPDRIDALNNVAANFSMTELAARLSNLGGIELPLRGSELDYAASLLVPAGGGGAKGAFHQDVEQQSRSARGGFERPTLYTNESHRTGGPLVAPNTLSCKFASRRSRSPTVELTSGLASLNGARLAPASFTVPEQHRDVPVSLASFPFAAPEPPPCETHLSPLGEAGHLLALLNPQGEVQKAQGSIGGLAAPSMPETSPEVRISLSPQSSDPYLTTSSQVGKDGPCGHLPSLPDSVRKPPLLRGQDGGTVPSSDRGNPSHNSLMVASRRHFYASTDSIVSLDDEAYSLQHDPTISSLMSVEDDHRNRGPTYYHQQQPASPGRLLIDSPAANAFGSDSKMNESSYFATDHASHTADLDEMLFEGGSWADSRLFGPRVSDSVTADVLSAGAGPTEDASTSLLSARRGRGSTDYLQAMLGRPSVTSGHSGGDLAASPRAFANFDTTARVSRNSDGRRGTLRAVPSAPSILMHHRQSHSCRRNTGWTTGWPSGAPGTIPPPLLEDEERQSSTSSTRLDPTDITVLPGSLGRVAACSESEKLAESLSGGLERAAEAAGGEVMNDSAAPSDQATFSPNENPVTQADRDSTTAQSSDASSPRRARVSQSDSPELVTGGSSPISAATPTPEHRPSTQSRSPTPPSSPSSKSRPSPPNRESPMWEGDKEMLPLQPSAEGSQVGPNTASLPKLVALSPDNPVYVSSHPGDSSPASYPQGARDATAPLENEDGGVPSQQQQQQQPQPSPFVLDNVNLCQLFRNSVQTPTLSLPSRWPPCPRSQSQPQALCALGEVLPGMSDNGFVHHSRSRLHILTRRGSGRPRVFEESPPLPVTLNGVPCSAWLVYNGVEVTADALESLTAAASARVACGRTANTAPASSIGDESKGDSQMEAGETRSSEEGGPKARDEAGAAANVSKPTLMSPESARDVANHFFKLLSSSGVSTKALPPADRAEALNSQSAAIVAVAAAILDHLLTSAQATNPSALLSTNDASAAPGQLPRSREGSEGATDNGNATVAAAAAAEAAVFKLLQSLLRNAVDLRKRAESASNSNGDECIRGTLNTESISPTSSTEGGGATFRSGSVLEPLSSRDADFDLQALLKELHLDDD